MIDRDDTRIAE